MFLHLGKGYMIPMEEVVMIGNLDSASSSEITEEFLQISEEEGFIIDYSEGEPKSFVLTGETIYMSIISSKTLRKRMNKFISENGGF